MSDPTPSTPITDALRACTVAERAAIKDVTPPYDGVRTWGDLQAVREQSENNADVAKRQPRAT